VWINRDTQAHEPVSGSADTLARDNIFTIGTIPGGESRGWIVDTNVHNVPYFCYRHPAERGTIVVLPKEEDSMTMNERLRFLDSVFEFRDTGNQAQRIRTGLARQLDPAVLRQIADEDLVKLQNKMLTIVFWDLSGFSALCEKLKQFPELVTEFLKEYFTQANKIIHTYNGVV
jgi:hypothetical protein